jgi:hypothetical protein
MITKDFQPLSIVEDEGFRTFVHYLDARYSFPTPKRLRQMVADKYDEEFAVVKTKLSEAEKVCLTTDMWTSLSTESYLAVRYHYINNDFKLETLALQEARFRESHTAENIATELERIISDWGLKDKVLCVVADSAANVKSASDRIRQKVVCTSVSQPL